MLNFRLAQVGNRVCCLTEKKHCTTTRMPPITSANTNGSMVMPNHIWKGETSVVHSGDTTDTSTERTEREFMISIISGGHSILNSAKIVVTCGAGKGKDGGSNG